LPHASGVFAPSPTGEFADFDQPPFNTEELSLLAHFDFRYFRRGASEGSMPSYDSNDAVSMR
jgi:hypothetical protein